MQHYINTCRACHTCRIMQDSLRIGSRRPGGLIPVCVRASVCACKSPKNSRLGLSSGPWGFEFLHAYISYALTCAILRYLYDIGEM